ncbi:MAG: PD-(D/E)XK nuclease family protein [Bacteroidales bacterium]|nr:PD-(D/E)XK nuclease family protein [Bacteroidales bacterium]
MKIVYNPNADAHNYISVSKDKLAIGHIVVADNGLLEQLELRMGLTCMSFSEMEREASYLQLLSEHHKEDSFYKKSYLVDDWGTARQLLQWRDTLVMAGWNKDVKGISTKLDSLADLEDSHLLKGDSDRWVRVLNELDNYVPFQGDDDIIEVCCSIELIPPIVQRVLEKLGDKVKYCYYENDDKSKTKKTVDLSAFLDKIKIYNFKDKHSAYLWAANSKDLLSDTVIVNRENKDFDNVLYSMNKPEIQSSVSDANPQIIQLFKLGMSLFERPLNINNLLSYLQLTYHPLPGALRRDLAGHLQSEGGLGDEWSGLIEKYFEKLEEENTKKDKDDKKDVKKKRKEKMIFLNLLTKDYSLGISVEYVKDYNAALESWARKKMVSGNCTEHEVPQLVQLRNFCLAMAKMLGAFSGKTITSDELMKWVKNIYRPINMSHSVAQNGSLNVLGNINGLICEVNDLIWLDCNYTDVPHYPYDFLNNKEIEGLAEKNIIIPQESEILKAEHNDRNIALSKVKNQIIVVISEYSCNKLLHEHPLVSEIKKLQSDKYAEICTDNPSIGVADGSAENCIEYYPQYYYKIENVPDLKRQKESYSAIEKLIHYPFDYLVEYFAGLSEYETGALPDMNTTKGKVAHLFIQKLTEDADYSVDTMQNLFDTEFDARLVSAVESNGAILNLTENKVELDDFKRRLKVTVPVLLDIMRKNNLTPVACENEFSVGLPDIGNFGAIIDMLLKDKDDNKVVFDFKWSKAKNYISKMKDGKALQLELYKRVLLAKGEKVGSTAYYILPEAQLISYDDFDGEKDHIKKIDKPANYVSLFTMIQNSFKFRKEELGNGKIEEGEMLPLIIIDDTTGTPKNNLEYLDQKGVVELETDYNEKNLKGSPYVSVKKKKSYQKVSIKEKPTTHKILKGRIK